jgi:archaellum component FlaC
MNKTIRISNTEELTYEEVLKKQIQHLIELYNYISNHFWEFDEKQIECLRIMQENNKIIKDIVELLNKMGEAHKF